MLASINATIRLIVRLECALTDFLFLFIPVARFESSAIDKEQLIVDVVNGSYLNPVSRHFVLQSRNAFHLLIRVHQHDFHIFSKRERSPKVSYLLALLLQLTITI